MSYSSSKSRAFEFASMSFRMMRGQKKLIFFPLISALSIALICTSHWFSDNAAFFDTMGNLLLGKPYPMNEENFASLLGFYFTNYLCIVFFNSALFACVMQILKRGKTTVGFGISMAMKRLHYIVAWSLISASVGVVLRIIGRPHLGTKWIPSMAGTAWTALTYFTIPLIITNGCNPFTAIHRSKDLLVKTWGTALIGNFFMIIFDLLLFLPIVIIGGIVILIGHFENSTDLITLGWIISGSLFAIYLVIVTTAHQIFRGYTFAYATGRTLPRWMSPGIVKIAFRTRHPTPTNHYLR